MSFFNNGIFTRGYEGLKLRPVGTVATLLLQDGVPSLGKVSSVSCSGCGPFPLDVQFGQPFVFGGQFMIVKQKGKRLFPHFPSETPQLTSSTQEEPGTQNSTSSIVDLLEAEDLDILLPFSSAAMQWNQELLTCVKDALVALVSDIASTKQGFIDQSMTEGMYSLWPNSEILPNHRDPLHSKIFYEFTVKPFYMETAQLPLLTAHDFVGLVTSGYFLSPLPPVVPRISDATESSNTEIFDLQSVIDFVCLHRQYTILSVPFRLKRELERANARVSEFTPQFLRMLCKTSPHLPYISSKRMQVRTSSLKVMLFILLTQLHLGGYPGILCFGSGENCWKY